MFKIYTNEKKLSEIVINEYCYLSILKPKDYKKLYKQDSK